METGEEDGDKNGVLEMRTRGIEDSGEKTKMKDIGDPWKNTET